MPDTALKYTVIKSDRQYNEYCDRLEELVQGSLSGQQAVDEDELLRLLIYEWDEKHRTEPALDPIELVKALQEDHGLTQVELAEIAGIGKSYMCEILNYRKRMSKKVIRNIADHFKIRQEALNKPYALKERVT